jgi:DNA-binding transcriptional LysR family regulator
MGYARRLLDLNDQALAAVRNPAVSGSVRLGLPQDFADTWLPEALARFARVHPHVRVEACVDRNAVLLDGLDSGELDLALVWDDMGRKPRGTFITELPMVWIGPPAGLIHDRVEPLPLIAFAPPCIFRQAAVAALDAAGIPWRVTFSSPGLSGLWAAVAAGLGVTLRTSQGLPATVKVLDLKASGLPSLPTLNLLLRASGARRSTIIDEFEAILREALAEALYVRPIRQRKKASVQ